VPGHRKQQLSAPPRPASLKAGSREEHCRPATLGRVGSETTSVAVQGTTAPSPGAPEQSTPPEHPNRSWSEPGQPRARPRTPRTAPVPEPAYRAPAQGGQPSESQSANCHPKQRNHHQARPDPHPTPRRKPRQPTPPPESPEPGTLQPRTPASATASDPTSPKHSAGTHPTP